MSYISPLGAHTIAILEALDRMGQSTARQVTAETGLEYGTVRQYLRRCTFRGLVTVQHIGRLPAYTVKPTWRQRLEPVQRAVEQKPTPETTVARALRMRPALHSVWAH